MQSIGTLVLWTINHWFEVQMTDPNRSSCSPYQYMLGDQILHFLEFFYYLLSHFENRWSNGAFWFYCYRWISDFQSGLINSKKIPKNIKFGLQAHIDMENKMNGLDRSFGFQSSDLLSKAQGCLCFAKHGSLTQKINI